MLLIDRFLKLVSRLANCPQFGDSRTTKCLLIVTSNICLCERRHGYLRKNYSNLTHFPNWRVLFSVEATSSRSMLDGINEILANEARHIIQCRLRLTWSPKNIRTGIAMTNILRTDRLVLKTAVRCVCSTPTKRALKLDLLTFLGYWVMLDPLVRILIFYNGSAYESSLMSSLLKTSRTEP